MKRVLVLLTVIALMMVILAMSVAPAFAARGTPGPSPRGEEGIERGLAARDAHGCAVHGPRGHTGSAPFCAGG
jgi:hypothetical protein